MINKVIESPKFLWKNYDFSLADSKYVIHCIKKERYNKVHSVLKRYDMSLDITEMGIELKHDVPKIYYCDWIYRLGNIYRERVESEPGRYGWKYTEVSIRVKYFFPEKESYLDSNKLKG